MKKKKHGGARPGSGPKNLLPEEEKKVTVPFQIKKKHVEKAKQIIRPIIDDLNSK